MRGATEMERGFFSVSLPPAPPPFKRGGSSSLYANGNDPVEKKRFKLQERIAETMPQSS